MINVWQFAQRTVILFQLLFWWFPSIWWTSKASLLEYPHKTQWPTRLDTYRFSWSLYLEPVIKLLVFSINCGAGIDIFILRAPWAKSLVLCVSFIWLRLCTIRGSPRFRRSWLGGLWSTRLYRGHIHGVPPQTVRWLFLSLPKEVLFKQPLLSLPIETAK